MAVTLAFPTRIPEFVWGGKALGLPARTSEERCCAGVNKDPSVVPAIRLLAKPPREGLDIEYILKAPHSIDFPSKYYLFRAQLYANGDHVGEVVCKAGYGPCALFFSLRREAKLYQGRLAPLQDVHVPKLIGYFEGTTGMEDERSQIGCLVLEYVGDALAGFSIPMSRREEKQKVLDAFLAIHKAGVRNGSAITLPYTIRRKDDRVFILGFGSGGEHKCCRTAEDIELEVGSMQPCFRRINCKELVDLGAKLEAWIPRHIPFIGVDVPIELALEGGDALKARAITEHEDHAQYGVEAARKYIEDFVMDTGYDIRAALARDEVIQKSIPVEEEEYDDVGEVCSDSE